MKKKFFLVILLFSVFYLEAQEDTALNLNKKESVPHFFLETPGAFGTLDSTWIDMTTGQTVTEKNLNIILMENPASASYLSSAKHYKVATLSFLGLSFVCIGSSFFIDDLRIKIAVLGGGLLSDILSAASLSAYNIQYRRAVNHYNVYVMGFPIK